MVQASSSDAVLAYQPKVSRTRCFESAKKTCTDRPRHAGRTILGDQAVRVFSSVVPALAHNLLYASHDARHFSDFIDSIEDQEDLRRQIAAAGRAPTSPNLI